MKVLFVNQSVDLPANMVSDYQADMVFHGLSVLDGVKCIESAPMWHMRSAEKHLNPEEFKKIWGKGHTLYGLLGDPITLGQDINAVDKIILPIHHTLAKRPEVVVTQLIAIKKLFPTAKICVIDGWDRTDIDQPLLDMCRNHGVKYFKRECTYTDKTVKPISFAFPEEKIPDLNWIEPRRYDIAPLIPVNQSIDPSYMSTYCYDDEESYYKMYQDSKFALTSKKGGWDTLRHYEIIANGAIPIFVDIDKCPKHTLWNFPKDLCKRVNFLSGLIVNLTNGNWHPGMVLPHCGVVNKENPGYWWGHWQLYLDLILKFEKYLKEKLLTKHLATYVLETMDENN